MPSAAARDSRRIATTSPPPAADERGHATRVALMEAALAQLERRGVLTGLTLSDVAAAVGVTSPNIYHHFASRQGLLRAALNHQVDQLTAPIDIAVHSSFVEWRTQIFDLITGTPPLRMTALLAIDDDPEYQPLALWDLAKKHYRRLEREGELPPDFDVLAAHVLTLCMAMGVAIYGTAIARQLGISETEIRDRTRAMFVTMMEGLIDRDRGSGTA